MEIRKKPFILIAAAIFATSTAYFGVRHFAPPPPKPTPVVAADPSAPILAPEDEVHAKYAGSESCKKCHSAEFEKWHGSNHGRAERLVTKEEDHKSFEPKQTLTHGKETSEAFVDADGLA
ncbi:MAG: multiheme c-type cytochrome, partial [Luteolibacter sp.]